MILVLHEDEQLVPLSLPLCVHCLGAVHQTEGWVLSNALFTGFLVLLEVGSEGIEEVAGLL